MKKRITRAKKKVMVKSFQNSLYKIAILLERIKHSSSMSEAEKGEISETIETLNNIIRNISDIIEDESFFEVVFGVIKKIYENWTQNIT